MIETQIQLPDDLYRDLKRLAEAKDWSLAETLRRGAQLLIGQAPRCRDKENALKPAQATRFGMARAYP
jgi:hypothetical protein